VISIIHLLKIFGRLSISTITVTIWHKEIATVIYAVVCLVNLTQGVENLLSQLLLLGPLVTKLNLRSSLWFPTMDDASAGKYPITEASDFNWIPPDSSASSQREFASLLLWLGSPNNVILLRFITSGLISKVVIKGWWLLIIIVVVVGALLVHQLLILFVLIDLVFFLVVVLFLLVQVVI